MKIDPHTGASLHLYRALQALVPDQVESVMGQETCDIEPQFMGFVLTYARLARLIPKHWTVIDLGCCYAAQAWYFREHKRYIGVDLTSKAQLDRFTFGNTEHLAQDIKRTAAEWAERDTSEVFAISNYVPTNEATKAAVREAFTNLYVFYPHGEPVRRADPGEEAAHG